MAMMANYGHSSEDSVGFRAGGYLSCIIRKAWTFLLVYHAYIKFTLIKQSRVQVL